MDWKYLLTSFKGRINRAKLWASVGVLMAVIVLANLIDAMLDIRVGPEGVGLVSLIATLATIYFALSVAAKRWHDRNKSSWWTLIILVPVIGPIWILVELGILSGTEGPNKYGPDPLG